METKVSDFFEPKFSYYSEKIDRPGDSAARAKDFIFTALVQKEYNKSDDESEEL